MFHSIYRDVSFSSNTNDFTLQCSPNNLSPFCFHHSIYGNVYHSLFLSLYNELTGNTSGLKHSNKGFVHQLPVHMRLLFDLCINKLLVIAFIRCICESISPHYTRSTIQPLSALHCNEDYVHSHCIPKRFFILFSH